MLYREGKSDDGSGEIGMRDQAADGLLSLDKTDALSHGKERWEASGRVVIAVRDVFTSPEFLCRCLYHLLGEWISPTFTIRLVRYSCASHSVMRSLTVRTEFIEQFGGLHCGQTHSLFLSMLFLISQIFKMTPIDRDLCRLS